MKKNQKDMSLMIWTMWITLPFSFLIWHLLAFMVSGTFDFFLLRGTV